MKTCPFLKKECIGDKCQLWRPVTVNNHVTNQSETQYDCVLGWMPFLLIQIAKETNHSAASADKVANEINAAAGTILLQRETGMLPGGR